MRRAVFGLLFVAMASASGRAVTMSQSELAKLPADVATERLMDQLAGMLGSVPYKPRFRQGDAGQRAQLARIATGDPRAQDLTPEQARNLLPHRLIMLDLPKPATFDGEGDGWLAIGVEFVTQARAGTAQGVCTLDYVELSLSPEGRHIDPSMPLGVSDFYVFKGFFQLNLAGRTATDARCRTLAEGPQIVSPIAGPDEEQALEGDRARRQLLREIERGDTSFDLDCSGDGENDRDACLTALRKMLPQTRRIRSCLRHVCVMSHIGDFEDIITVASRAGHIRSVEVHGVRLVIH